MSDASRGRLKKIALAFIVSGALIGAILTQIDPEAAARRLREADLRFVIAALGTYFATFLCRAVRFQVLTHRTPFRGMMACIAAQSAINRRRSSPYCATLIGPSPPISASASRMASKLAAALSPPSLMKEPHADLAACKPSSA